MSYFSCRWLQLFSIMALLQFVAACATSKPASETWVWRSRGQFVGMVEREAGAGQNQHPVAVSASRLRAELASLRIKPASDKTTKPLLGERELENLTEQLPAALLQARPDQDVVFAVVGADRHFAGLVQTDVVTTGRVFFTGHRLNLILGMARTPVEGEDRRLQPFTPGSRYTPAALAGTISATSPDVSFASGREDWVIMALPEKTDERTTPEQPSQRPAPAAQPLPQSGTRPPAGGEPGASSKSIEDRLRTLRELREKGLITEDEYRAKRESILKEL